MRQLATVKRVDEILPIKKANRIELAVLGGWQVVCQKGEYLPGDLAIYCEIDSFLPDKPQYKFLGTPKTFEGKKGHRLKTIRLRGEISQGLLLKPTLKHVEGQDVTEELGIVKWERSEIDTRNVRRSSFPSFLIKTDAERIQNIGALYSRRFSEEFHVSEKLEGTSFTCCRKDGEFIVCSRNQKQESGEGPYWDIARKYNLEAIVPEGFGLQGEIVGPRIQGNIYGLEDRRLYVFDMFDIAKGEYVDKKEMTYFCENNGLHFAPEIDFGKLPGSVRELIPKADGKSVVGDCLREGLVFVSKERPSFKFKVVSNKYLLEGACH